MTIGEHPRYIDRVPLLLSAYIGVNIYYMAVHRQNIFDITGNRNINPLYFFLMFFIFVVVLMISDSFFKRLTGNFSRFALLTTSFTFAVLSVVNNNLNIYFNMVILAVMFYIISYCFCDDGISLPKNRLSFKALMTTVSILVVLYTIILGHATILRYMCYTSSTFDFGIFAQMFENMAKTGLQTTTVERNMELSHFAVHFSPIYYLFLPGYMIFRTPEYLLVIQALFVASGAFPLVLIARKLKFTNEQSLLFAVTYLFYPTLTGGIFFDFHENKFLTILILWLFYFILSGDPPRIYLFAVLTLMVKEDSFLYVLFVGIYMISGDARFMGMLSRVHGIIITALSLTYFGFVSSYLKNSGLGVMMYRYNLFLDYSQESFSDIIINVITNPSLLLSNILTVEKFEFALYMFLPLCFLPFMSKKYRFIILIIPFVIMNLATDYIYQYDINFQYAYGTSALLFFLAAKNLSRIHPRYVSKLCVVMACCSIILFMSNNYNKIHRYHYIYGNFTSDFTEASQILEKIPSEASVTATTFLIPHLIIRHEEVYMGDMDKTDEYFSYGTDYIINDIRSIEYTAYNNILAMIKENGYEKVDAGSFVEVFKKIDE